LPDNKKTQQLITTVTHYGNCDGNMADVVTDINIEILVNYFNFTFYHMADSRPTAASQTQQKGYLS